MKKIYLYLLFFCYFSMASTVMGNNSNRSTDEIDLYGDFPTDRQRSLVRPVKTLIAENSIEVDFNAGLGSIVISIYDEEGNAVYQQTVSTYSGMYIVIDISSFEEGDYTIEFTNSQGQYLSGDFVIQF